jgi:uncharacterized protein
VALETVVVILVAMTLASVAKAVTGLGGPIVAIPIVAGFLGVQRAVIVMAIPSVVSNMWLLWAHRSELRHTRDLPALLGTGIVGTAAGTFLLLEVNERVLAAVLAGLIGAYLVIVVSRPDFRLGPALTRPLSPVVGLLSGVMQGTTGISAPLAATYLHGYRLPPLAYVFSVSAIFGVFAVAQVGTLIALDAYDLTLVLESLVALVPIAAVFPLGIKLSRRLSPRTFNALVLIILVVMGLKLAWDALAG